MKKAQQPAPWTVMLLPAVLLLTPGSSNTRAQSTPGGKTRKGTTMTTTATTHHATGTFEVKVTPAAPEDKAEGSTLSRMSIDKQFHGGLEATSKGEMLGAMSAVKGSAGYVAIERVTGTLQGHSGSFVLQHSGTMNRGELQMSVTVVPDSGSGQLTGLAGKMTITIANGKHSYDFECTLRETIGTPTPDK